MTVSLSVTLCLITDGRANCICETLDSLVAHIPFQFQHAVLVNDSGNKHYATWLNVRYPTFTKVHHETRRGFAGAVRSAWENIPKCDYVMTLEDDFTFNRDIDVVALCELLADNPHLAQVVLRRQAWNTDELAAGGVVELHPEWYIDKEHKGHPYLEHRMFYSTNVNVMPYAITLRQWPNVEHSEGVFSHALIADGYSFAYWGARTDAPWIHHIGTQRIGIFY